MTPRVVGTGGGPRSEFRVGGMLAWHTGASLLLLAIPAPVFLGLPVWRAGSPRLATLVALAVSYLASGVVVALLWQGRDWSRGMKVLAAEIALAVFFSAYFFSLLLVPGAWYSRWLLLTCSLAAAVLIALPAFIRSRSAGRAGVLFGLVGVAILAAYRPVEPAAGTAFSSRVLLTSHGAVAAVRYDGYIPPVARGGGIHTLDTDYVLATADGDIFRFGWVEGSDSLQVTKLPLRAPLNREEFAADVDADISPELFRVADILVRPAGDSLELITSHHYWFADRRCFVVRLSTIVVSRDELASDRIIDRWRTLYETQPCLPIKRNERGWPFAGPHIGGRLADLGDGRLVVTVGDQEFDGWNSDRVLPQDSTADYGKMLLIDEQGRAQRLTMGHRNPQGLHVGADGRIWSTEHGPQGGDALHEIVTGANYGWPYVTYGTDYGDVIWPLNGQREWDDSRFRPPVFAWVPSIGISNLIEVRRGPVAEWRGDLLIGSMEARSLFRVRREGSRVAYVEPIPIDARVRDIVEGPDGRIVLWTDELGILKLDTPDESSSAVAFARCSGCHAATAGVASGVAPSLYGIYGRDIAADPDFSYSPALQRLTGRWDEQKLDAFLSDPDSFAPGTLMTGAAVADANARDSLIEYLKGLR